MVHGRAGRGFQTTSWSLVRAAGAADTATAQKALEALCEAYWPPLYAFVCRRGYEAEAARDLTQAFFAHLLEGRILQEMEPEGGRLRSFLLTSLKNLLKDEHRKDRALKRGSAQAPIPLDLDTAESGYGIQPADIVTPEDLFARHWATTVLRRVFCRLRGESESNGKSQEFERLKTFITGERPSPSYRQVGLELGLSPDAVKMAVHRLRRRFGETLRAEIRETVSSPGEIDDEIRYLFSVLRD